MLYLADQAVRAAPFFFCTHLIWHTVPNHFHLSEISVGCLKLVWAKLSNYFRLSLNPMDCEKLVWAKLSNYFWMSLNPMGCVKLVWFKLSILFRLSQDSLERLALPPIFSPIHRQLLAESDGWSSQNSLISLHPFSSYSLSDGGSG